MLRRPGRFLDEIADGVWAICEETFWGVPAHMGARSAASDCPMCKSPSSTSSPRKPRHCLAWTGYLMGPQLDSVNPLIRERLESELERRVLSRDTARATISAGSAWHNSSPVNNWNPWIHSNVLACALLLDNRPRAPRADRCTRSCTSLDRFLDSYHDDGGCDEGPGYWSRAGASLFECLDLLQSASARQRQLLRPAAGAPDRRLHLPRAYRGRLVRQLRRRRRQRPSGWQPGLPLWQGRGGPRT